MVGNSYPSGFDSFGLSDFNNMIQASVNAQVAGFTEVKDLAKQVTAQNLQFISSTAAQARATLQPFVTAGAQGAKALQSWLANGPNDPLLGIGNGQFNNSMTTNMASTQSSQGSSSDPAQNDQMQKYGDAMRAWSTKMRGDPSSRTPMPQPFDFGIGPNPANNKTAPQPFNGQVLQDLANAQARGAPMYSQYNLDQEQQRLKEAQQTLQTLKDSKANGTFKGADAAYQGQLQQAQASVNNQTDLIAQYNKGNADLRATQQSYIDSANKTLQGLSQEQKDAIGFSGGIDANNSEGIYNAMLGIQKDYLDRQNADASSYRAQGSYLSQGQQPQQAPQQSQNQGTGSNPTIGADGNINLSTSGSGPQNQAINNMMNSPMMQSQMRWGIQGVNNGLAAQGMNSSGRQLTGLLDYSQGVAANSIGQYTSAYEGALNRYQQGLESLTQSGATAAGASAQVSTNQGLQSVAANTAGLNTQANAILGSSQAQSQGLMAQAQMSLQASMGVFGNDFMPHQGGTGGDPGVLGGAIAAGAFFSML